MKNKIIKRIENIADDFIYAYSPHDDMTSHYLNEAWTQIKIKTNKNVKDFAEEAKAFMVTAGCIDDDTGYFEDARKIANDKIDEMINSL